MKKADRPGLDVLGFRLESGDEWLEQAREAVRPREGYRLGPYEVLEEIRHGGQGIVFRARDPNRNRQVALKRLAAGALATDEMRARFERELRAASALEHPGIVKILGMEVIDGQSMMAMEWIDGVAATTWAERLHRESPQEAGRAILEMFVRVGEALEHAHSRGVIHRDLKPSNILVDERGFPHVVDFGLAKLDGSEGSEATTLTSSGQMYATPAYCSPEHLSGLRHVDARSDVYSLGVLLFEMLPSERAYGKERDLAEILVAVRTEELPRPSKIDPSIDRDLDTIVSKATSKNPSDRYQTAADLVRDIRLHAAHEPLLSEPPGLGRSFAKIVRRHRLAVVFVLTVAVLLVGFAIFAGISALRFSKQRDRAVLAQEATELEARSKESVIQFIIDDVFGAFAPWKGRPDVDLLEAMQLAEPGLSARFEAEPELEARVRSVYATIYSWAGEDVSAEPHARRAVALWEEVTDPDLEDVLDSRRSLALVLLQLSQFEEAKALVEENLAILRRSRPSDLYRIASARVAIAAFALGDDSSLNHLSQEGMLEPIVNHLSEAIAYLRSSKDKPRKLYEALDLLAVVSFARGDLDGALSLASEVRDLCPDPDLEAKAIAHLGKHALMSGHPNRAEKLLREAIAKTVECYGIDHRTSIQLQSQLAILLTNQLKFDEAESLVRRCLSVLSPADDMTQARVRSTLGYVLSAQGQWQGSFEIMGDVRERFRELVGDAHSMTLEAWSATLLAQARLGRWVDVQAGAEEMLDIVQAEGGERRYEAEAGTLLVESAYELQEIDQAAEYVELTLEVCEDASVQGIPDDMIFMLQEFSRRLDAPDLEKRCQALIDAREAPRAKR